VKNRVPQLTIKLDSANLLDGFYMLTIE